MNKPFKLGMQIKVCAGPLEGYTGTVTRVLMRSPYEAWVEMDADLPPELVRFPENDNRHRHTRLDAEDVEPI